MNNRLEFKKGDEQGGSDSSDHNPKEIAAEKKADHYSNGGGHQERGDANKQGSKRN